jgi:tRNA modification GTPase
LRDGLTVAIAGPPNAGKSTLLNLLARREAAIVSPIPGTTRDVIEVHLDLGGYPVTVLDTAGIRDSADPVEQEGVRRARERAGEADLILWVVDASADAGFVFEDATSLSANGPPIWSILNKSDLTQNNVIHTSNNEFILSNIYYLISCKTGEGLSVLFSHLTDYAAKYFGKEPALVTRERHRKALISTIDSLDRALTEGRRDPNDIRDDVLAEELRHAAQTLGRLTGRVDVEDILDVIFRDFCIGK